MSTTLADLKARQNTERIPPHDQLREVVTRIEGNLSKPRVAITPRCKCFFCENAAITFANISSNWSGPTPWEPLCETHALYDDKANQKADRDMVQRILRAETALDDAIALIEEEHRRLRTVIRETDDALVMSSNPGGREITNEVLRALEVILNEFEG